MAFELNKIDRLNDVAVAPMPLGVFNVLEVLRHRKDDNGNFSLKPLFLLNATQYFPSTGSRQHGFAIAAC
jgi:hypothetical protein